MKRIEKAVTSHDNLFPSDNNTLNLCYDKSKYTDNGLHNYVSFTKATLV